MVINDKMQHLCSPPVKARRNSNNWRQQVIFWELSGIITYLMAIYLPNEREKYGLVRNFKVDKNSKVTILESSYLVIHYGMTN